MLHHELLLAEAAPEFRPEAAISFVLYTIAVFVLAILSHRLLKKKSFLKEYFLGSRGLGVWALAMTYAATAASGGSFTGFPALIYEHGWILALWIASYMIVPICAMGLLGKRLNQVARKSDAITVPDVFRDRFDSGRLGVIASLIMAIFMVFNLVAQFKAGAIIIETMFKPLEGFSNAAQWVAWLPENLSFLSDKPPAATYCLGLLIFAAAVIAYTTYGGFRAVVWTDVLQGVVMFFGVLILLFFTLREAGSLSSITENHSKRFFASVSVEATSPMEIARGDLSIAVTLDDATQRIFTNDRSLKLALDASTGKPKEQTITLRLSDGQEAPDAISDGATLRVLVKLEGDELPRENSGVSVAKFRFDPTHTLVTGPGFQKGKASGFLPFGMAISFFVMWAFSGAGQPTTMVRLMAFDNTQVYRRAMFSVCVYYTLIYIPLIIIFVAARDLLPRLDTPDAAMAVTVLTVVPGMLAGIIMAAPFAAVMSTVDSFLLAISSSLVRDVYQRSINPNASPERIRRLSYLTTMIVGVIVMFGAINPPEFLQTIIILTGTGLSCSFLAPMFFTIYWRRMTAAGCLTGILSGFGTCSVLYLLNVREIGFEIVPGGFHPVVWGMLASITGCIVGSLVTSKPPKELVEKYFGSADS